MSTETQAISAAPGIDGRIKLTQLELLYKQLPLGLVITALNAALLAYILSDVVNQRMALSWFCAVLTVCVARGILYTRYKRASPTFTDYNRWRAAFAFSAFVSAGLWGVSGVALFPASSPEHQAFIGFVLAGMSAGASSSMAAHYKIFRVFLILTIAPYMLRLLFEGTPIHIAMAVMSLAFIAALCASVARHTQLTLDALRLRFVNDDLARDLERTLSRHQLTNAALQDEVAKHQRTTDSLELAVHDAEASVRAKAQFLANMSHEIRTPMNGVFGMTDLLMRTDLDQRQQKLVGTIKESAKSLLTIINDILDLSRIEAGKLDLDVHEFCLRDLMERSVELFASQAHKKGIEISLYIDPDVPTFAKGDSGRIKQIILNLVGNALKFTKHGEIRVRVSHITADDGAFDVLISIADTGIGIDSSVLTKLFQPFTQAETSISRRFGGTGLGLAIARHLADMMGGNISLDSQLGEGTTATVRLHLEYGQATHVAQPSDRAVLAGARILVIDDRSTNREIIASYLQDHAATIQQAPSTKVAWPMLLEADATGKPFHATIVDMLMPDENGLAFARRIKAHADLCTTKIVIATSLDWQGDVAAIRAVGVESLLTKPIRRADLIDTMAQAISGTRHAGWSPQPLSVVASNTEKNSNAKRKSLRATVLLAEDNAVNIEVAKEYLASFGCTVAVVGNGLEALATLKSSRFDIALMDCQMPIMDGLTATRHWRAYEAEHGRTALPIVALTANAFAEDRSRCLEAGMSDYLSKPYMEDQLHAVLAAWLPTVIRAEHTEADDNSAQENVANNTTMTGHLDDAALAPLRTNRPDLLARIISTFLTHAPTSLTEIASAASEGNCERLSRAAHSLKSSSANVGATELAAVCRQLEHSANANDLDGSRSHALTITAGFAAVERSLTAEHSKLTVLAPRADHGR